MNSPIFEKDFYESDIINYKIIQLDKQLYTRAVEMDSLQLKLLADSLVQFSNEHDFRPQEWNQLKMVNGFDSIYLDSISEVSFNYDLKQIDTNDAYKLNVLKIVIKPIYDSVHVDGLNYSKEEIKLIHNNPDYGVEVEKSDKINRSLVDKYFHRNMLQMVSVFKYGTLAEKKNLLESRMRNLLNLFSYSMFLIMPISAVIFLIFFYKKFNKYYEHFVHAVSLHTLMFIVLGLIFGLTVLLYTFSNLEWWKFILMLAGIFCIYIALYFINSVYVFYRVSISKAIFSSVLMCIIYSLVFFFVVSMVMAIALIF